MKGLSIDNGVYWVYLDDLSEEEIEFINDWELVVSCRDKKQWKS